MSLQCGGGKHAELSERSFRASPSIHFVDLTRTQRCKDEVNRRAGVQPRFYLGPILLHELNYSPPLLFPSHTGHSCCGRAAITAPYWHLLMKQQYSKQVGSHTQKRARTHTAIFVILRCQKPIPYLKLNHNVPSPAITFSIT